MSGLTLDAGALIAFERGDRDMVAIVARARAHRMTLAVPSGAVGQAWCDGWRQVRLGMLLASEAVDVEPLDDARARAAGQLCGVSKTRDVIDAPIVLCARRRGHGVVTSDPDDMMRLDPTLRVVRV